MRPSSLPPGMRLWHYLMKQAPGTTPAEREETRRLLRDFFAAARRQGCSENPWDALLAGVREALSTWLANEHDEFRARTPLSLDWALYQATLQKQLDAKLAEGEGKETG